MSHFFHKYKKALIIGFLQWALTMALRVDRAFFIYDIDTPHSIIVKELYLIFLLVAWCFLFKCFRKIREKDENYLRGLHFFLAYLSVMLMLLLVLWPGTWSWDDIITLLTISGYTDFNAWQHIITGIYQGVMLQLLPFPGGLILLQNVIISICVAYSILTLERVFNISKSKNILVEGIKLLPFLLPLVIMYQFSGYRMGLYVYLELVMIVKLLSLHKEKRECRWSEIILLSFITVVVSSWRTESFIYIPCVCLLILFICKKVFPRYKKIVCIAMIVTGFFGISQWQNKELADNNYQVISLLAPGAELVRAADVTEDARELEIIDKVVDIDIIKDNPTYSGEKLFWGTECVRNRNKDIGDDYTSDDYSAFLKALIKLSFKYPQVVLKERWNMFIRGIGLTGDSHMNVSTITVFDGDNGNEYASVAKNRGWIAFKPIFKDARNVMVNLLCGENADGTKNKIGKRIICGTFIPMIILLCEWIKLLIKKKWYAFLLCSAVILKILVIFLTEPSDWAMYQLSFYFLGYVCGVYLLLRLFRAQNNPSNNLSVSYEKAQDICK